MSQNENKKLHGRAELKKFFSKGQIPTEAHYAYLIDSAIIQHDDGISKDEKNGYVIAPIGTSSRLMTFYKHMDRLEPYFFVERDLHDSASLKIQSGTTDEAASNPDKQSFFLHQNGNLGIGKKSNPSYKLDVDGFSASQGRIGSYKCGKIPADGEWYDIVNNLDNCQAFEVVARTGKKGTGKFSMMHAIALSTYGDSHSSIKYTHAYFGFFWNKLKLRWVGSTHNYSLQIRTNRNFGKGIDIYYNVGKLWDDELFLPEDYYHTRKNKS